MWERLGLSTKVKKQQFLLSYGIFIFNGFLALSIGALLPFIRDSRGLSYAFLGLLVGLHSVGNLFSSFTAGVLPLYVGRKASILIFNSLYALAFILILVTHSNALLIVAFTLTGIARGATSNFCNIVVNDLAPGKTWIFSGLHSMFAIGAFTLPLIVMAVASFNWQIALYVLIVAGLLSFAMYAVMPLPTTALIGGSASSSLRSSRRMTKSSETDGAVGSATSSLRSSRRMTGTTSTDGSYTFFRDRLFWLVTLSLTTYLAAEQGVIGWLVTYFRDTGILSIYLAQVMTSVLWITILIGRLTTAYLSTRINRSKLLVIMGIGLLVFFTLMMATHNPVIIVVGISGFGLSMAGIYPTVVSFSGALIQKFAMAWSFILTGAALGAVLMPNIIGFIAQRAGIFYGMASVAGALILTNGLLFALIRYVNNHSVGIIVPTAPSD